MIAASPGDPPVTGRSLRFAAAMIPDIDPSVAEALPRVRELAEAQRS